MPRRVWIGAHFFVVLCVVALYSLRAQAYPGNLASGLGYPTGSVLGSLDAGCNGCHSQTGSGPTQIALNGHPLTQHETVAVGEMRQLVISFVPTTDKPLGGLLVAHYDTSDDDAHGTLIQGSNTHSCKGTPASGSKCNATLPEGVGKVGNTEITQEMPTAAANGTISLSFSYRAPATQCGTFSFRAFIAIVNGDTRCGQKDFGAVPVDFSIDVPCPDLCKDVTCPAAGPCHAAGVCDSATGLCSNPNQADGTACSGGDKCLQSYQCVSGNCVGSNPKTCGAAVQCAQASRCNSTTGACDPPALQADGSSCDDGNPCTTSDRCQSGTCAPGLPITCPAPPTCFERAQCEPSTGHCGAPPPTPSGTACDNHIDSTRGDVCNGAGSCGGTPLPSNVYGWGANPNIGANSPTASNLSTPNRFIQLAAGTNHVVGLRADGVVMTWGDNSLGQLGLGTLSATPTRTPTAVPFNPQIFFYGTGQVFAGNGFSVVLEPSGSAFAWGVSDKGQTGIASATPITAPRALDNRSSYFLTISAGAEHVVGLGYDGHVYSWGSNGSGELGRVDDGTGFDAVVRGVAGLSDIIAVAAGGATSLALKADGTVWAWGSNTFGHLGTGTTAASSSDPIQVAGLSGVTKIASSQFHDLALLSDGTVRAWGLNAFGELGVADSSQTGNAALAKASTPVGPNNQGAVNACKAVANRFNNPAITQTCVAIAQQLGIAVAVQIGNAINTNIFSAAPVQVNDLTGVISIAAGAYHSTAIVDDGRVLSWGSNSNGQLGLPISGPQMSNFSVSPVAQPTMTEAVAIAAGGSQSVALKAATATLAWGRNSEGQIGNGANNQTELPVFIPNFGDAKAIAAAQLHTLAIRGDGSVWAWGENPGGELGTDDANADLSPQPVVNLMDVSGKLRHVVAVSAGAHHNLALKSDGTVWAWGDNAFGQLTGAFAVQKSPMQVTGSNGPLDWGGDGKPVRIIAISCGANHSLAIQDDGTVWSWGQNTFGQIGNGLTANAVRSPYRVPGIPGPVKLVSGGRTHTLALTVAGGRWSWGEGEQGELGAFLAKTYLSPSQGGFSYFDPMKFLVAGDQGSLGLEWSGQGAGWGVSTDGQLGLFYFYTAGTVTEMIGGGKTLALGKLHSLALSALGTVASTGSNGYGQLGFAAGSDKQPALYVVRDMNGVQAIAAGAYHSVALIP